MEEEEGEEEEEEEEEGVPILSTNECRSVGITRCVA